MTRADKARDVFLALAAEKCLNYRWSRHAMRTGRDIPCQNVFVPYLFMFNYSNAADYIARQTKSTLTCQWCMLRYIKANKGEDGEYAREQARLCREAIAAQAYIGNDEEEL